MIALDLLCFLFGISSLLLLLIAFFIVNSLSTIAIAIVVALRVDSYLDRQRARIIAVAIVGRAITIQGPKQRYRVTTFVITKLEER